jgi:hypothetical protein
MSVPASYSDEQYAPGRDPWGFEGRWYERRKYACTMAALSRECSERAFEPGCSVGVLSELLANPVRPTMRARRTSDRGALLHGRSARRIGDVTTPPSEKSAHAAVGPRWAVRVGDTLRDHCVPERSWLARQ